VNMSRDEIMLAVLPAVATRIHSGRCDEAVEAAYQYADEALKHILAGIDIKKRIMQESSFDRLAPYATDKSETKPIDADEIARIKAGLKKIASIKNGPRLFSEWEGSIDWLLSVADKYVAMLEQEKP